MNFSDNNNLLLQICYSFSIEVSAKHNFVLGNCWWTSFRLVNLLPLNSPTHRSRTSPGNTGNTGNKLLRPPPERKAPREPRADPLPPLPRRAGSRRWLSWRSLPGGHAGLFKEPPGCFHQVDGLAAWTLESPLEIASSAGAPPASTRLRLRRLRRIQSYPEGILTQRSRGYT